MPRIFATPSTNALWDMTGALSFDEGGSLPYSLSIAAGSWRFYRVADGPVVTVAAAATAPSAMVAADWTLADLPSAGGNQLSVTLVSAPASGGSAITGYEWRLNGGAWAALGAALGAYPVTVPAGAAASVQVRAVNAVGAAAASDTKSATPTAATASFFTMSAAGPQFSPGVNWGGTRTQLRIRWRSRVSATLVGNTSHRLFAIGTNRLIVNVNLGDTSTYNINNTQIQIDGTNRTIAWPGGINPFGTATRGVWTTREYVWDSTAMTCQAWSDGTLLATGTISGVAGTIASSAPLSWLALSNGTQPMPAGFEVEFLEIYPDGSATPSKVIAGNAATVNADPWKLGGDAT